jgi:hypothetical protein
MSATTSSSVPTASDRYSHPPNFAAVDRLPRTLGSSWARSPPSRYAVGAFRRLTASCIGPETSSN